MRNEPALSDVFAALASHDRLAILRELSSCPAGGSGRQGDAGASISEIADRTGLSRFSASRHLSILREVDLVGARRVGHRMLHSLNTARFETIEDWLYTFTDADGWPVDQARISAR